MLELYRNILLIITVTRLFFYLLFCSVEILLYSKLKYHILSSIDNTYHITDDPVVTLNVGKNSFQNVITFFNSLSLNMKDVDPIDFNEKFHSFIHSFYIFKLLWWCIILLIHWKLPHIFQGTTRYTFLSHHNIDKMIMWPNGVAFV